MKKKLLALSVASAMLLAACGGGGGGGQQAETPAAGAGASAPAAAESGDNVQISLMFWDGVMQEAYREIIADFESRNPGITMDYSVIGWGDYWTNLATGLPAGVGPDVFWLNHNNAVTYMPTGLLMDITDWNLDLSGFDSIFYQPYMRDGRLFAVPIFYDTIAMFYNKALFDEAGVPHPTRGWTWDDMRDKAFQLTVWEGNEIMQAGVGFSTTMQGGMGNFVPQNGGWFYSEDRMSLDLNNPGALGAFNFMRQLMFEDRVALTPLEWTQLNAEDAFFLNNMMAMTIQGMWRVPPFYEALGENLGIAHLPRQVNEGTVFHNLGYVVAAHTEHPEEVRAFLEYATTTYHGDLMAPVFLPTHRDSQHLWLENFPTLNVSVFTEAMDYATPTPIAAVNAAATTTILMNELERILTSGELFTSEILEEVNSVVNAAIDEYLGN